MQRNPRIFRHLSLVTPGREVGADTRLRRGLREACGEIIRTIACVAQLLRQRRVVVLAVGVDDVRRQLRALIDEEAAPTQEIACVALGPRIDVGHGKHAAAEEAGDLGGVDAIVLGLAAVDRFHVEGVAEREGDLVVLAEIGEPIPREHALATDDQARAIGCDGVAKSVGVGGQIGFEDGRALRIEDVREHASCMEIDAGVECVRMVVEAHG